MKKNIKLVLIILCTFIMAIAINAQSVTTGAIEGLIKDADGNLISGAIIKAVHLPTGTGFVGTSNTNGKFYLAGVKAGGPYSIIVEMSGFKSIKKKDFSVKLGEKKYFNFIMRLATIEVEEINVTASIPVINPSRTGAAQNVTLQTIENMPTISRSLSDLTRIAPQFAGGESEGAFSAGGRNNRYNNIQIDGAQNNDLFGLSASGTPGGQSDANPISLDAIQEFQIVMAPYDVRQGMFTGGGINVITKSGTNELHGSAYFYGRNQNMVGKGPSEVDYPDFSEKTGGFTLGGPIIKNKLFFFLSGEMNKKKEPQDFYIDGSGADYDFGHKSQAEKILSIFKSKYGYDAGTFDKVSNEKKDQKIFFRLDWNINENHRLTFRQNYVNAEKILISNRYNHYSFGFRNSGVNYKNETFSSVLQLNSNLADNIFNELKLNYTYIHDNPTYLGDAFPRVSIRDGKSTFYAGSEEYRQKNELKQNLIEITNDLTLISGKHTFIFGTHNEFFKFYNVFIKKAFGSYSFDSVEDFEKGKPSYYDRYYSVGDDPNAPSEFWVYHLSLYAGDEWSMKDNFTLTYGVRMDVPIIPDTPKVNPGVESSFGIPTDQSPSGNILWSPRAGFNWDIFADSTAQLRGGLGVFSGRTPFVWISNQFGNTGMDLARHRIYDPDFFITDPNNQPINPNNKTEGDINLIEKDFNFPQVFRANLAFDYELPFGFIGTVEYIYTKNINEIMYENINIAPTGEKGFDGRPLFGEPSTGSRYKYGRPNLVDKDFYNVIYLSNTNKGFEHNLSFQLQKEWKNGDNLSVSYNHGVSKSLFSGTSSQAISNWRYNVTEGNPNEPKLSYSAHDTRHRFLISYSKKIELIHSAPTVISLFYEVRSGRPYSTIYRNDVNGDGQLNDSIYVPKSEDEIILKKGTWAELDDYIRNDSALDEYRGRIAPRNISRDPWNHQLDLKLTQNIPVVGRHKLQIMLTIKNFFNIFDKDSGVVRYIAYNDSPLLYLGIDKKTGKPMFEFSGKTATKDARYSINQSLSRWKAMLGVRYSF